MEEYEGNLLFVSHDRYFIERFASRIWMLENGQITDFRGGYQDYLAAKARGAAGKSASDAQAPAEKAPEPKEKKEKPKRPGGTKNLEKEVAAAERAVGKAEEQMDQLEQQIQEAAADYLKLQELYEQREAPCPPSWRRPGAELRRRGAADETKENAALFLPRAARPPLADRPGRPDGGGPAGLCRTVRGGAVWLL